MKKYTQTKYEYIAGDVYLASEVDARIAELAWCLREAMQWNWMEDDLPEELIERCDKALVTPRE
jgi:hypothetical protein